MSSKYQYCPYCGTKNLISSKFCANCGKPLVATPKSNHPYISSSNHQRNTPGHEHNLKFWWSSLSKKDKVILGAICIVALILIVMFGMDQMNKESESASPSKPKTYQSSSNNNNSNSNNNNGNTSSIKLECKELNYNIHSQKHGLQSNVPGSPRLISDLFLKAVPDGKNIIVNINPEYVHSVEEDWGAININNANNNPLIIIKGHGKTIGKGFRMKDPKFNP